MKNKNLIIGVVLVVSIGAVILIAKPFAAKKTAPVKRGAPAAAVKGGKQTPQPAAPAKKAISKDKGAITVKIVDSKKRAMTLRIKAFKSVDSRSSVYAATFTSNTMQELPPGAYDIEIETTPQTIHKNIRVAKGIENIADLGSITGSVIVKALNAQKKDANYPVRVLYSKSNVAAMSSVTNRGVEVPPGIYDIEIGTTPLQYRKDVKIGAGREVVIDLGCVTGTLLVRAVDENNNEIRYPVRITRSENNEVVATAATNRPLEILQGTYNVEIPSTPKQSKNDIKVNVGEEAVAEFLVQPPPPAPKPVAPRTPPAKIKR